MLYWLPRIAPLLIVTIVLAFGLLPTSAEQAADWIFAALLLLGLFSLMPVDQDEQRF
jgi:hypothetical protein